ncbi:MAG: hypothetical protein EAZ35_06185 [Sphingobacteriia bacterium]|nr:MAG: hypothetical protein EAZ35_06185 [Sphingobacteriia bacterium]
MKSTQLKLVLSIICIALILIACKKERLPEFYFRCKINGETYIPSNCTNCKVARLLSDSIFIVFGNKGYESVGIGAYENPFTSKSFKLNNTRNSADYDNSPLVNDI